MTNMTPPPAPGVAPIPANLASWGQRALAFLVDMAVALPGILMMLFGYFIYINSLTSAISTNNTAALEMATLPPIFWIGWVLSLVINIWNLVYRQGKTGQSIGKKVVKIKMTSQATNQPIGFGMGLARYLIHSFIDSACLIGYLWPLWDQRRETFADKILKTQVTTV